LEPLQKLQREIERKKLAREFAEVMAEHYLERSDWGWLVSIFDGWVGTLTAVLNGQHSNVWNQRASQLGEELMFLEIERHVLLSSLHKPSDFQLSNSLHLEQPS